MSVATATRERPILFSGEMVRAILDGRKTQTRRVVKPQPDLSEWRTIRPSDRRSWTGGSASWSFQPDAHHLDGTPAGGWFVGIPGMGEGPWRCPYGTTGDQMWVRETHAFAANRTARPGMVWYRADGDYQPGKQLPLSYIEREPRWRPSIHMPRWASRVTLEVTDVRVEQLRDITDEDAVAEGVEAYLHGEYDYFWALPAAVSNFARLWDSLASRGFGWDTNPWVWVVSFRRRP